MNNILNNIKIAFFDIDGTLTNSAKIISKKNIQSLLKLKAKGITIVLVSGRCHDYIMKLTKEIKVVDYIISANGACLYDNNQQQVLTHHIIPKYLVKKIEDYCDTHQLDLTLTNLALLATKQLYQQENIYQGIVICHTKNEVEHLIEYIKQEPNLYIPYISSAYYKDTPQTSYTLNINLSATSKGQMIDYLLTKLNLLQEQSICFGDNLNDLSMFEHCGIKVAMENAALIIKQNATYITLSNDNDGVAYFINKYFN